MSAQPGRTMRLPRLVLLLRVVHRVIPGKQHVIMTSAFPGAPGRGREGDGGTTGETLATQRT
jgi:hypothetical protein